MTCEQSDYPVSLYVAQRQKQVLAWVSALATQNYGQYDRLMIIETAFIINRDTTD